MQTFEHKVNKKSIENSEIVSDDEIGLIRNWIDEKNADKVSFKLLYRSSLHGKTGRNFHRKCDFRGKTITFIKTLEGRRFGGYSNLSWQPSSGMWLSDDASAFVFSLDHKSKFTCNDQSFVIHSNSDYGPIFGAGFDLAIFPDFSGDSYSNFPHSYGKNEGAEQLLLTGGECNFTPIEIETYLVN
jgi:hypothetical protein